MAAQFRGAERCAFHHQPRRERVAQVMPGEVLDPRCLEGRVDGILHILNRLTRLATVRVRKYERTVRNALVVQRLQRRQRGGVQRQRMWTAALGPWNGNTRFRKST